MKRNLDREVDHDELNYQKGNIRKTQSSDEVEESLRQIVRYAVLDSAKFCSVVDKSEIHNFLNNKSSEFNSFLNRINAELFNGQERSRRCRRIAEDYGSLRRICLQLTNIQKQESCLDYSNRLRFLFFRFLTGLSFGVTIFLISFVAFHFGIPLPLCSISGQGNLN